MDNNYDQSSPHLDEHVIFSYLSHMLPAKAQIILYKHTNSPGPLVHTQSIDINKDLDLHVYLDVYSQREFTSA